MTSGRVTLALTFSILPFGIVSCSDKPTSAPPSPASTRQDIGEPGSPSGTARPITTDSPSLALSADELYQQFKKDEKATKSKYARGSLEVTGVVKDVGIGAGDRPLVTLEAGGDVVGLACYMKLKEPWAKVTAGQTVKLKGTLPRDAFSVVLMDCEFADPAQKPAIVVTAEQLAKEHAADLEATQKKYAKTSLVVTGKVLKKEKDKDGSGTVILKGTDKVAVSCGIGGGSISFDKPRLSWWFASSVGTPLARRFRPRSASPPASRTDFTIHWPNTSRSAYTSAPANPYASSRLRGARRTLSYSAKAVPNSASSRRRR